MTIVEGALRTDNSNNTFWKLISQALSKGVADSDAKARTECFKIIKHLKKNVMFFQNKKTNSYIYY